MENIQPGLFGKTSSEPYLPTEVPTSGKSSTKWMKQGRVSRSGQCWMHNTLEYPNDDGVCSSRLVLILQQANDVDRRYFLSAKACQGILRRAERRGKELPVRLKIALEQVASGLQDPTPMES